MTMKLAVKMTLDDKEVKQGVDRTTKQFDRLDKEISKTSSSVTRLRDANGRFVRQSNSGLMQVDRQVQKLKKSQQDSLTSMKRNAQGVNASLMSMGRLLSPLATGIGTAFGAGTVIAFADQMQNLENQLRLTVDSEEELIAVRQALLQVSNDSRSDIAATTELYTRMFRATRDLNVSQGDLLDVTETITKAFAVSGATTVETEGAVRQLSQALASGVFRGEEFNSVAEQGPRLMQILQDEYGKTAGELREMAQDGKLTAEVVLTAIRNQGAAVREEFNKMPPTMGQATTAAMNSLKFLIGTMDDASGASSSVAQSIVGISDKISDVSANIESGKIQAVLSGYAQEFVSAFSAIGDEISWLSDINKKFESFIFDVYSNIGDFILEFARNAPAYINYAVDRMGAEFSAMVDLVPLYVETFVNSAKAHLIEFANDAGAIGKEILDRLKFWGDDSFDLSGALAANEAQTKQFIKNANEQANGRIEQAKLEREGVIAELDKQLQQGKDRLKAIRDNAEKMRVEYDKQAKNVRDDKSGKSNTINLDGQGAVSDSQLEKLREDLMSEEELRAEYLQRRIDMINNAGLAEVQAAELIRKAVDKHVQETQAAQLQRNNLILLSSQQLFGGIAGLVKQFAGEQSGAFKAMFALQKGFAIAQGVLNLSTAISQASILPFPTNIPAMAQAATAGASILANLRGANYQGQAHDGLPRVPAANEGTYMLRKDEMVMSPRQRDNFEKMQKAVENNTGQQANKNIIYNMSPTFNIDARNGADKEAVKREAQRALAEYDQVIQQDFSSNGPRSQMLRGAM